MRHCPLGRHICEFALGLFIALGASPLALANEDQDNDALTAAIIGTTVVHNGAFPVSLAGVPPVNIIAEGVVFAANIAQKKIPPVLNIPTDRVFSPNASGQCVRKFDLPQSIFAFSDAFGFIPISSFTSGGNVFYGVPLDWGELGTPQIFHQNSEVILTANNSLIELMPTNQMVRFPAGVHTIRWKADTLIDPVFDVVVPGAFLATSIYSYMKAPQQVAAIAGNSAQAAQELTKFQKAVRAISDPANQKAAAKGVLKFVGTKGADYLSGFEEVSATHIRRQTFTVFDVHPPTLQIGTPNLVLEATDFGGVLLGRVRSEILDDITAFDECDRSVSLSNNLPALIPLGNTTIDWTVRDFGPINAEGDVHSETKTQIITIRDTQAPIMVPPPGRVLEVDPADNDPSDGADASGIDPDIVDLGFPLVVDLADPMPTIASNAPPFFPVNSRTEVTWSATDRGFPSPNTSTDTQLITVKELGANTAPNAFDKGKQTLTSKPVNIRLRGLDTDMLDGRVDPLGFEIVDRPGNGEFVAPLFPFFIEDYRTNPAGPFGQEFLESNNRVNWLYDNYCRNSLTIPIDFVYTPQFVQVTDDGTVFMIDTYWKCTPSDATGGGPRISKWDEDGVFLGQRGYNGTNDAFVLDEDGFIYTNDKTSGGSSTTLTVSRIKPNFDEDPSNASDDAWRFDNASTGSDPVSNSQYSYARVDSDNGVVYVNDRRRVFVFDIREDLADPNPTFNLTMGDRYLGALKNAEQFIGVGNCNYGSSWTGFAMDVDSQGNLYVADSCADRIHKFEPSFFDSNENFVFGDYVGWMGKCESSTNKACDAANQVSKGYSCTDQTCTVELNNRGGEEPGQFDTPVYITLDPNDVMYVADFGNSRIQRFAIDGTFGGEAKSTGTGVNRGEQPGFILGNMGQPKAVSVNSNQFFVVDVDESFVHVFETTPFKNITDSAVTVTYVSNFNFHSDTDTFTYMATDGLADSNIATVSIDVSRNFRRPIAIPAEVTTNEDTSVDIVLEGDDPDGILGVDFNGLDTLSYLISRKPKHGKLTGLGENRTYTPDPDFFGEDSFTFKVNDGLEKSQAAKVVITVDAVDDPPKIMDMMLPTRAAAGFPIVLIGEYVDDGAELHYAMVTWGNDGGDEPGDFFDPDGEGGPMAPVLQGVKVMEPLARSGTGTVIGQHTFSTPASQTITYCMMDEQEREDCMAGTVSVESLVSLNVAGTASKTTIETNRTDIEFIVTNMQPDGIPGLSAQNVSIKQPRSSFLKLRSFPVNPAGCVNNNGSISCDAGQMAPGEEYRLVARFESRRPVIYDIDEPLQINVSTTTNALQDAYVGIVAIRILADPTDSDGDGMTDTYEDRYNLNPGSPNDANRDPDGDGLTNLEEFNARTKPRNTDTDGDGLSDAEELLLGTDPTRADSDGDTIPDKWELDYGLDPLDRADGDLDPDRDGLTNQQEYERMSDPSNPDTDGDGLLDGVDNDPVVPLNRLAGAIDTIINLLLKR